MSIPRDRLRIAWESLIADGLVVPTGEMRLNPVTGEFRPVYVHHDHAKAMGLPLPPLRCTACEVEQMLALLSDNDGSLH